MALVILAFLAAFLLTSSVGILIFYRTTALRRLSRMVSSPGDAALLRSIAPTEGSRIERLARPFENILPRTTEDVSTLKKRLNTAGYREKSSLSVFYSSKVLVPGALCILATVTQI